MRRVLVRIHLWLGVTIGLLWTLQGFTGAVLVFHREIDRFTGPAVSAGPMAPVETILTRATEAAGGARIVRLSFADPHRDLMEASYVDADEHLRAVRVDASTGQVLGTREMEPMAPSSGSVMRWVLMLHMALLSGRAGEVFIGVSGLVLLSTAMVGLWLAWPPRRAWRAVYGWRKWRSALQRLYGWHRAIGLTSAVVIATIALAGVLMTFESDLRSPAYRSVPTRSLGSVISPQAALEIAQRRMPEARWGRISMPTAANPVYTIRLRQPDEHGTWLGRTTVALDAHTGRVASLYDPTTASVSDRIFDVALPLHTGELLGTGGRILMMLTGLALPTLYVTGLWRFLRGSRAHTRPTR